MRTQEPRLLLVEDDEPVAASLLRGLEGYGYAVEWCATGHAALNYRGSYDLVLLDLGLPDADGLDICAELRARTHIPIIVISARNDETDRVVGLEIGADDYISKPFGLREVVARVRAAMRRVSYLSTLSPPLALERFGPRLSIDRKEARVRLDGHQISLTPREYALLSFLTEDPGALISREHIMEAVWDVNWYGSTKTLDVHVAALRRKLEGAVTIEAVRGIGFRLIVSEIEASA